MREIEIKARIADRATLLKRLSLEGVTLSDPVTQHDRVYGREGVRGDDQDNHAPWLRIRTETRGGVAKHIFTLKKSVTNQLDSIEHETEVSDERELLKIIEHIDFSPYSDLTKTRQKTLFGEVEICVDTVDGLGDFIEVEKLVEDEDVDYEAVIAELWGVLNRFGVTNEHEETSGYDVLMRKHQGIDA